MRIYDIISYLERCYPLSLQASFDNCGLLIGNKDDAVNAALISLDCTEEVVDEAILLGANLIISHHPIIFKGLKKITHDSYLDRILLKAIKNGISIYAIHTNLDHSLEGVNKEIANRLGVLNPRILDPIPSQLYKLSVFVPLEYKALVLNALFEKGAGTLGNYSGCSFSSLGEGSFNPMIGANPFEGEIGERSLVNELKIEVIVGQYNLAAVIKAMQESHPYEEVAHDIVLLSNQLGIEGSGMIGELDSEMSEIDFLNHLKKAFNCEVIRHTNLQGKMIKKIAFCGGSGSFLLDKAKVQKADIFITGDFKYHEFFDADNELIIADIGHYESEQFTSDLIYRVLTQKFTKFALYITKLNTNPIKYF